MVSKYSIERGAWEQKLSQITPVKQLLQFAKDPAIVVSPPESAKSTTKVHMESSYEDLLKRVRSD